MNNKRIISVDVIRGFALLGLFFVHVIELFELYWVDPQPNAIRSTIMFIFSGKAYSIFAFLFGFSFYILLEGNPAGRHYSPWRFFWRMILLVAFGYIHSLIYPGDFLQQLAVFGIVLLLVFRLPTGLLLALAVLLLGQLAYSVQALLSFQDPAYAQPRFWALSGENFQAYMQPGLFEFLAHTSWKGQAAKWVLIWETGSVWHIAGLFIAGLLAGRWQLFERRYAAKTLFAFLVCALLLAALAGFVGEWFSAQFPEFMPRWAAAIVIGRFHNLAVVAIYIAGFIALMQWRGVDRLLAPLARCGRMSLTLYIGQSFMVVPLLYGWGLGWYDSIMPLHALLLAAGLWLLQMTFATLWFRYFRYGPLEWLWRAATWGDVSVPMRRGQGAFTHSPLK